MNPSNLDIIKNAEGLKLKAYKDIIGVLTIGYGHTNKVKYNDVITIEQAELFLNEDVSKVVNALNKLITVEINQNEFDALTSLVYNIGVFNFKQSTLLKLLNSRNILKAADEFLKWRKADGKVIHGLELRREKERKLFLKKS